ncbi:MAG TPA: RNA 3'-terminal phosphate cyclase [Pyrinomonadaceae bacterium]|jgi:RNA 3'-terminal phosphate cyclase (ATP)|nr:RNA 3'-terminal phosphate cyclase [Pyrinomonadaceae bacterium]
MLTIDGSFGEGGGQIIRSSLALSLVTGKPFRVERVRANRDKPGLKQQHLTAVKAAAEVSGAVVEGAAVGAREFAFSPGVVTPGDYVFRIGTAGSTTLVLQTILPPLMIAPGPSTIRIEGGTHNPHAPPFDFLEKTFLPLVNQIGPKVTIELEHYGFYPPGGGALNVLIEPAAAFRQLDLLERGATRPPRARALVVNLPPGIAERELAVIKERTGWGDEQLIVETSNNAISPGNIVMIEIESEHLTEVVSRIGERGVRAEIVAEKALDEAWKYLDATAPVGEHLADQLLIPLALGAGGSFVTGPLSLHTTTNIEIVKMFLGTEIAVTPTPAGMWRVDVGLSEKFSPLA